MTNTGNGFGKFNRSPQNPATPPGRTDTPRADSFWSTFSRPPSDAMPNEISGTVTTVRVESETPAASMGRMAFISLAFPILAAFSLLLFAVGASYLAVRNWMGLPAREITFSDFFGWGLFGLVLLAAAQWGDKLFVSKNTILGPFFAIVRLLLKLVLVINGAIMDAIRNALMRSSLVGGQRKQTHIRIALADPVPGRTDDAARLTGFADGAEISQGDQVTLNGRRNRANVLIVKTGYNHTTNQQIRAA
jgi:hypothetical protein